MRMPLRTTLGLMAISMTMVLERPAGAAPAASGVTYEMVATCATGAITVRANAFAVPGDGAVDFTISVAGGSETFSAERGSGTNVTVDALNGSAEPAGVTVTESGVVVGFLRVADACPGYTDQQAGADLGQFHVVAPTRVLDTRRGSAVNYTGVKPAGSSQLDFVMTGKAGIPADAVAVVLNVTATEATAPGYVQVMPTGRSVAGAYSNLNVQYAGQTIPNSAIVPIGDNGSVSFFTQSGTHLVVDVFGYFSKVTGSVSSGRFVPVAPLRRLDTRPESARGWSVPIKPYAGLSVAFDAVGGLGPFAQRPSVSAVVLNVTATESTAPGFIQAGPSRGLIPGKSSNLNVTRAGQTIANMVIVPVDSEGWVSLYTQSGTHLLVDILGYFTGDGAPAGTGGLYRAVRPERVLDSRSESRIDGSEFTGAPGDATRVHFQGLPRDVGPVILNVTATNARAAGFVQVGPNFQNGTFSTLNVETPEQTIANATIIDTDNFYGAKFFTQSGADLVADIFGSFTQPDPTFFPAPLPSPSPVPTPPLPVPPPL